MASASLPKRTFEIIPHGSSLQFMVFHGISYDNNTPYGDFVQYKNNWEHIRSIIDIFKSKRLSS